MTRSTTTPEVVTAPQWRSCRGLCPLRVGASRRAIRIRRLIKIAMREDPDGHHRPTDDQPRPTTSGASASGTRWTATSDPKPLPSHA